MKHDHGNFNTLICLHLVVNGVTLSFSRSFLPGPSAFILPYGPQLKLGQARFHFHNKLILYKS
jgi:hypothetical protein